MSKAATGEWEPANGCYHNGIIFGNYKISPNNNERKKGAEWERERAGKRLETSENEQKRGQIEEKQKFEC